MPEVVEIQNHKEPQPRSERLSDEEMGNLLSAFGNSEAKAITLGLMGDGRIYTRGDLHRSVIGAQGEKPSWRINRNGPFTYCEQSLSTIGLVTREIVNPDLSVYGYQISNYGRRVLSLVGLLLNFSQSHASALVEYFGHTVSSYSQGQVIRTVEGEEAVFKKRSPMTRLKIFYELVTAPKLPMRLGDLAEALTQGGSLLEPHLSMLSRHGMIQYQAREVNQPFVYHKLSNKPPEEEPPKYQYYPGLTRAVFSILREYPNEYLTREDVFKFLPDEQKERVAGVGFLSNISNILSHLVKTGYADVKQFKWDSQSEINLSDEQWVILAELVEIIDRFQNQDPEILEQGRRYLYQILSDPNAVSQLMARAEEASSGANKLSRSEADDQILSIITSHPQGITNKEIRIWLEQNYGRRLSNTSISKVTRELQMKGLLVLQSTGNLKTFFPKLTV
ncbi:MAG: hypothetical protein AAB414_03340 [Patescibacteria group bacterium]